VWRSSGLGCWGVGRSLRGCRDRGVELWVGDLVRWGLWWERFGESVSWFVWESEFATSWFEGESYSQ
jgi:hypothetical protein